MPSSPSPRPDDATLPLRRVSVAPTARCLACLGVNAVAALGVGLFSVQAFTPRMAVVSCALGWAMLAIAAIDARRFMIPDVLSLPAIPLGLLASGDLFVPWSGSHVAVDHAIGAALGGAIFWLVREAYYRLRGREGLGLGDVKLAAAAGAWTGWQDLPNVVLLAAVAALSLALMRAAVQRTGLAGTERLAFGAFLAPAIWIVWVLRQLA
jgi:leader peptidase (prepilin peptidase)/N-methyltransferase